MAEVLGVVASGIAVGQLAAQIITASEKLYNLWASVKGAPEQVSNLLCEIKVFAKQLEIFSHDGTGVAQESRFLVETSMLELRDLLSKMEAEMNKEKGKMKGSWGRVKAATKIQETERLVARLERTKSTLTIAVMAYNMQQLQEITVMLRLDHARVTSPHELCPRAVERGTTEVVVRPKKNQVRSCKTSTWWCPFGWVQLIVTTHEGHGPVHSSHSPRNYKDKEWRIFPHAYLGMKSYSIGPRFGIPGLSLRPIYVLPEESPIFQACKSGDLIQMKTLVDAEGDLICATTEEGWNLLHVAAAHLRPNVCKWLIEEGVPPNAVDYKDGRSPLHLTANQSGRYFWPHHDRLIDPIDNVARPKDTLETLRVLVEEGQCDPMHPPTRDGKSSFNSSQTALHLYTGPLNGFQYLIKQQHFEIDLSVKNARGMDIEDTQINMAWASSTTIGRFLMESGSLFTDKCYLQQLGSAKLHLTVRKFIIDQFSSQIGFFKGHESIAPTILKILKAGVDAHSRNESGDTPLTLILAHSQFRQNLAQLLMDWFNILREAGYDIQKYIRAECTRGKSKDVFFRTVNSYSYRTYQQTYQRSIYFLRLDDTDELDFRVKGGYLPRESQPEGLPGAWKEEFDIDPAMMLEEVEKAVEEIWFTIGPLKDGFQDIKIVRSPVYVLGKNTRRIPIG